MFGYGETVTLISRIPSGEDSDGNDVFTESPTLIANVPVWPGGEGSGLTGSEQVQGRDTVESGLTLLLPVGTDVGSIDLIIVYGVRYEVSGQPAAYRSPFTGLNPGILVRASLVEG